MFEGKEKARFLCMCIYNICDIGLQCFENVKYIENT